MRLRKFKVTDYRSINNSGDIEVADRLTVLVGRNESGKTALVRALHGLKAPVDPAGDEAAKRGFTNFTFARDYPRDRPRRDFNDQATVVTTTWDLTDADRVALKAIWPRAATAAAVMVERPYALARRVGFVGESPLASAMEEARQCGTKVADAVGAALKDYPDAETAAGAAVDALTTALATSVWTAGTAQAAAALRSAFTDDGHPVPATVDEALKPIESIVSQVTADQDAQAKARAWVERHMPVFVYLDEWDEVPGQHNIPEYLNRRANNSLTDRDRMFEKLLKVADLNAEELNRALSDSHEERMLLTDRASRVFTRRLRELWKDREIEVQFRVDSSYFDVFVKDKDTNALVPLDERSRGFRWYFSFYVTFTADTMGGDKTNAVLLLDEPGLFLHATAQAQLLTLFRELPNQIIYTTHSPFMIDPADLGAARTVNLLAEEGTIVSPDLSGDARTLFPLQAALGYDLTQTLFIGSKNIVVEGVTDYWILKAAADHLREHDRPSLAADIVLTPAGGAQKVSYLVALLASQRLNVVVLLDMEPTTRRTREDIIRSKLIRQEQVLTIADAFPTPAPAESDVEDLLDAQVYQCLAEDVYAAELGGRSLVVNASIPRIVPRLEQAFQALGITFHKSRVAKRFLEEMGRDPAAALGTSAPRFEKLFGALTSAVTKLEQANRDPFR